MGDPMCYFLMSQMYSPPHPDILEKINSNFIWNTSKWQPKQEFLKLSTISAANICKGKKLKKMR